MTEEKEGGKKRPSSSPGWLRRKGGWNKWSMNRPDFTITSLPPTHWLGVVKRRREGWQQRLKYKAGKQSLTIMAICKLSVSTWFFLWKFLGQLIEHLLMLVCVCMYVCAHVDSFRSILRDFYIQYGSPLQKKWSMLAYLRNKRYWGQVPLVTILDLVIDQATTVVRDALLYEL